MALPPSSDDAYHLPSEGFDYDDIALSQYDQLIPPSTSPSSSDTPRTSHSTVRRPTTGVVAPQPQSPTHPSLPPLSTSSSTETFPGGASCPDRHETPLTDAHTTVSIAVLGQVIHRTIRIARVATHTADGLPISEAHRNHNHLHVALTHCPLLVKCLCPVPGCPQTWTRPTPIRAHLKSHHDQEAVLALPALERTGTGKASSVPARQGPQPRRGKTSRHRARQNGCKSSCSALASKPGY